MTARDGNRSLITPSILESAAGAGAASNLNRQLKELRPSEASVEIARRVPIPTRDGTVLRARIYRPRNARGVLPTILSMGPYLADLGVRRAFYFAQNGFAYVSIDIRGRGDSDGSFEPHSDHGPDGYDAVEWVAAQPWCDGNIGMRSASYDGMVQWQTAKERPPHLRSIFPTAAARPAADVPFFNSVFTTSWPQWLTYVEGKPPNPYLYGNQRYWHGLYAHFQRSCSPFRTIPDLVGMPDCALATWIEHPTVDAFWDERSLEGRLGAINIPILTLTGHYDDTQFSALSYYREHVATGSAEAAEKHNLVIGPWDHLGCSDSTEHVGGLPLGAASRIDLLELQRDWFEHTLRGGPKPSLLRQRVAYYVTGAEEWRWAADLDTAGARLVTYRLGSTTGAPNDLDRPGYLGPAPRKPIVAGDTFEFDPRDVRAIDVLTRQEPADPIDVRFGIQRVFEPTGEPHALFGQGLVYETEPLVRAVTVRGVFVIKLRLTLDVPDADFHVGLWEVAADRSTIHLASDILRARHRRTRRLEELVVPGTCEWFDFASSNWIARRIAVGNRLRLVIRCPNNLFVQKNYCGGGVVADESGSDARVATIRLDSRSSVVEIPIEEC